MKKPKNNNPEYRISMILVLSLIFVGCNCYPTLQYTYRPPEYINEGIEVGFLEEVNIDTVLLKKAVDKINYGKYDEVHSLLIFNDNKLVFEEYFPGHRYKWDAPNHHGDWIS